MPNTPDLTAARDRLIVALDFPAAKPAHALVDQLEGSCRWFKVGLELYLAAGSSIVEELRNRGYSVFLDLKLHDIPNTVAGAVRSAAATGASLLTLHTLGGPAMLEAAVNATATRPNPPQLLGVTVLTSMDEQQMQAVGLTGSSEENVLRLAQMAMASGLDGVVASPLETSALRETLAPWARLVIPGIRPAGDSAGDQSRVATPGASIAAGASMLVVGRPITKAADPRAAAEAILTEIDGYL